VAVAQRNRRVCGSSDQLRERKKFSVASYRFKVD
jgi:hypothetical protein